MSNPKTSAQPGDFFLGWDEDRAADERAAEEQQAWGVVQGAKGVAK